MSPNTTKTVYNLTVEGAHCYYANGILVHNCDTVTQFLNWARTNEILVMTDEQTASDMEASTYQGKQTSVAEIYGV